MNSGYFVYVIKSFSTEKIYTGLTSDIDRRLKEHNQHLSNVKATQNNNEKYLKSGSGREFRDNLVE